MRSCSSTSKLRMVGGAIAMRSLLPGSQPPVEPVPAGAEPFVPGLLDAEGGAGVRQERLGRRAEPRGPVATAPGDHRDPLFAEAGFGAVQVGGVGDQDDFADLLVLQKPT